MLARFSRWVAALRGKNFISNDLLGNSYYTRPFTRQDGVLSEKRWVEFKGDPNPNTLPAEWSSWLSHTRRHPPSQEEMLELANRRRLIKIKVAILKEEEEKLKFKARSSKTSGGVDMSPRSMEKFMKQIAGQDAAGVEEASAASSSSEPSGTGEQFRPGSWKP